MPNVSCLDLVALKTETAQAMSRSLADISHMQASMLCLNKRVIASRIALNASREALRTEIATPMDFRGL